MRIRPLLVTVQGVILPHPYGGQDMQVMVNLDQQKLLARHLTPVDIHDAPIIAVERRLTHPCVVVISHAARNQLL